MSLINRKNLYWNSISFVILSILGFINFTLNLNTYDSVVFGYYLLINAYWSIGGSIDLGFGVSTIKNISESKRIQDYLKIKKIVNTFLIAYFFVGIVISIIIFLFFYIYDANLLGEFSSQFDSNLMLLFFGLGFFVKYLSGFLVTVYEGLAEFVLVSKINLLLTSLNTIFTIIIFIFKLSLYYLVVSQFLYGTLLFIVLLMVLSFRSKYVVYGFKYFDFSLLKKHGLYNVNIQLSFTLTSLLDPIMKSILSFSLGLQFVTYFEAAKKVINLTNGLIHSALKGLLNKLSEANVVDQLKDFINTNIHLYSNLSLDYSVFIYGILNPLICLFMLLWFKSYETMMIFIIFLLPYTLINVGGPLYSILMVEGKGGKLVLLQSINVVIVSLSLYCAIIIFNSYLGILGFFFATIVNTYLMIYFLRKYLGFDLKAFYSKTKIRNLLLMNFLLIIQLVLFAYIQIYVYELILVFTLIYCVIFIRQLIYYVAYFYRKFTSLLALRHQN